MSSNATSGGGRVFGSEAFQVDERAARRQARPQRAAQVDALATPVRRKPPRADFVERECKLLDRVPGGGDFGRAHLREVLLAQHLLIGRGQPCDDLALLLLARAPSLGVGEQRFVHAGSGGRRLRHGSAGGNRRHQRHELFEIAAPLEEDAEGLVEHERMLVALHEDRVQRPIEVLAGGQAGGLNRLERIEHRARPDRQAGAAQRAGEIDDVVGKPACVCCLPLPLRERVARATDIVRGEDRVRGMKVEVLH